MLNGKEREVLEAIACKCAGTESCLISVDEVLALSKKRKSFDKNKVLSLINSLELDGYFDVVFTERSGERVLCVNLTKKGLSFRREIVQDRRKIVWRVFLAVMSAIITFSLGRVLFYLFS